MRWTINGKDVPTDVDLPYLNLGASVNTGTILADLIDRITGQRKSVQVTLDHDGEFGFVMTLTLPLGNSYQGLWANLYHYDETTRQMVYETSGQVDEKGGVALTVTHASQYAIVLDLKSHTLPFTDVNEGDWYSEAVEYVYRQDIMSGNSAETFGPNSVFVPWWHRFSTIWRVSRKLPIPQILRM